MDFMEGKGAEQVINDYLERELSEYRRAAGEQQDIAVSNIAPEAREAFSRKPYYSVAGTFVRKPSIK